MTNYIFIDGSYYTFFRIYALKIWWKMANSLDNNVEESVYLCDEFIEKFKKIFVEKIEEIPKKLNLKKIKKSNKSNKNENNENDIKIIVAQDCPRDKIWRHEYYENYKGTRSNNLTLEGELFKIVYDKNDNLFEKAGVNKILKLNKLEADDIIALSIKYLKNKKKSDENMINDKYYIIASDMDYLQLLDNDNDILLYDLKYVNIIDKKNKINDFNNKKELFIKIVCGDKSDNIMPIYPKCGRKTGEKIWEMNDDEREKYLKEKNGLKNYEINKKIIDFNEIPSELVRDFNDYIMNKL